MGGARYSPKDAKIALGGKIYMECSEISVEFYQMKCGESIENIVLNSY